MVGEKESQRSPDRCSMLLAGCWLLLQLLAAARCCPGQPETNSNRLIEIEILLWPSTCCSWEFIRAWWTSPYSVVRDWRHRRAVVAYNSRVLPQVERRGRGGSSLVRISRVHQHAKMKKPYIETSQLQ
ncbi:hypothetical protein BD324DRAFT_429378 [Kockovaella imperatae]|uniref:Secreted protein n=1 Tax=Kockovaella imperatae TaxID=4999 RepID=A0A1Y1UGG8_9TREE|nr:hypothetical protein BD324DRAFT_429378 [Kockovaella imperatae]ORX37160.1 hypothetical protein BD324DRAFT_429378 [Kockovaella imperatae]